MELVQRHVLVFPLEPPVLDQILVADLEQIEMTALQECLQLVAVEVSHHRHISGRQIVTEAPVSVDGDDLRSLAGDHNDL